MLTLRAPSFHVGAGRAFTRCIPTSGASCRHPAPARRFLLRPPAEAPCATLERTRSPSPRGQSRPTVSSLGGAISSVARRWRNDSRRLPSYRILCLPPQIRTAFQPCTPNASRRRTEPFVWPSLLRSGMTPAHRFARWLALRPVTLRREPRYLSARGSAAPRGASGLEMRSCPPCQRLWQGAMG